MDEEERNYCCLALLLTRVGVPTLRRLFIRKWDDVGTFMPWTDCAQNGRDLLTKFRPFPYEKNRVMSGDTTRWDLNLLVNALLKTLPPMETSPTLVRSLKCLRETKSIVSHVPNGKFATADFEKLWDAVCNALQVFGATSEDLQKVKQDLMLPLNEQTSLMEECVNQDDEILRVLNTNPEPETVPPEILARGPQAQSAFKQALKSGQVKNKRLPVVLVGQSQSGKTSLLRSLNGEKFNASEDSTVGAKLQCSLSKVDGDWEKNGNNENFVYNHCTSMEIVKHLKKPAQPNTDNKGDINSLEINLKESSIQDDSAQNYETACLVEEEENNTTQDHFDKQEPLPDGVAMYTKHILENPDSEKQMENYLFFHTMDFAGQPVYSVTHPVFLPPKGIYLLVHSLEKDLHAHAALLVKTGAVEKKIDPDPMTNMGHLKYWLSLIDANSPQERTSPVFVVSTHADKPFKAEVQETAREILDTLRKEGIAGRHVVHGIYIVNNTVSGSSSPEDSGIKELKTQIYEKAKNLPQMNEDIPLRWLLFEKKLGHLVRNEKRKHISFQEAESIASECEVDISSDELETLLNYLHDLKVIIHFPETGMIIIDTQWLLDMFAKVITVQPREYQEGYEGEWRKLEDQGIIDVKFFEYLWRDLLNHDTSVESLIIIMDKFSLICKQGDGSFLVPAMLSNSTIDDLGKIMKSANRASPLVVRFKSSHLPLGLFPRLLVAVDKMCNLRWKSSTPPHLSRNCARFSIELDGDYELRLVLMTDTTTITVALIEDVNQGRRHDVYVQQCKSILEFLRETLDEMVTSCPWMKSLAEFVFCIRCPICHTSCKKHNRNDCYRDACVHLVSEKELLKTTKPRCQENPINPIVIPDKSYTHWFPRAKSQSEAGKKDVEAICSSSCKDEDLALRNLHGEERDNFFQLTLLLFRDGNQKLREFFKSQWPVVYKKKTGTPPPSLWTDIPNDATEMKSIETKPLKFQFNDQKVNFNSGDTNAWDFSLITTVLNNSTLKFVTPSTLESKAIKELKKIRNKLIGHALDAKISTAVYNTEWPKACNALKTFGVTQDEIDQVKKDVKKPLDELLPSLNESLKVEKEILDAINKLEKTIKDQHQETRSAVQQGNAVVIETVVQRVEKLLKCAPISSEEQVQREDVAESGSSHVCIDGTAVAKDKTTISVVNTVQDLSTDIRSSLKQQICNESQDKNLSDMINKTVVYFDSSETSLSIRSLTKLLRQNNLTETIQWMKANLPAGVTGPLLDENVNIREMGHIVRNKLTIELTVDHKWTLLAERLQIDPIQIRYVKQQFTNPADEVLKIWETKSNSKIGYLYDLLVELELPVIADVL